MTAFYFLGGFLAGIVAAAGVLLWFVWREEP